MTKEKDPDSLFPVEFPNNPPLSLEEIRTEAAEAAKKIAKAAEARGPIEYPDRTSEAARDQGWGTVSGIEEVPEVEPGDRDRAKRRGTHPSLSGIRPLPKRGSTREGRHGDSERDTGNPDYLQPVQPPLTEEEKKSIEDNVPIAREAITAGPDPEDVETVTPDNTPKRSQQEIETGRAAIQNIRDNVLQFKPKKNP